MADADLEATYRLFTWRITSNYVPHWDFERMKDEIESFDDWCRVYSRWGARHRDLGDEALAEGDAAAAGLHYVRAGLFFHWASFLFPHRPDEFRAALAAMHDCWRRAAPHTSPPMEPLEVPFEGARLPGYLRRPEGVERPPLVVLVPGGDSTKEEFFNLTEHILARGIATFAFDGPGHGAVSLELKLRPDYEVPIRAVIDHLYARPDLDTTRLAGGPLRHPGARVAAGPAALHGRGRGGGPGRHDDEGGRGADPRAAAPGLRCARSRLPAGAGLPRRARGPGADHDHRLRRRRTRLQQRLVQGAAAGGALAVGESVSWSPGPRHGP